MMPVDMKKSSETIAKKASSGTCTQENLQIRLTVNSTIFSVKRINDFKYVISYNIYHIQYVTVLLILLACAEI